MTLGYIAGRLKIIAGVMSIDTDRTSSESLISQNQYLARFSLVNPSFCKVGKPIPSRLLSIAPCPLNY